MTSRLSSFEPELTKAFGGDKTRARDLIRELESVGRTADRNSGSTTIIRQTVTENRVGGGGGGGASAADSQTINTATTLLPGSLCYYAGATVAVADSNTAYEALWYVVSVNGNGTVVRKWTVDADILETGTGNDGSGVLYLYRNGGVTRNRADLVDSFGTPVSGVQRVQIVGTWNALSSTQPSSSSYIRASISLLGAMGG